MAINHERQSTDEQKQEKGIETPEQQLTRLESELGGLRTEYNKTYKLYEETFENDPARGETIMNDLRDRWSEMSTLTQMIGDNCNMIQQLNGGASSEIGSEKEHLLEEAQENLAKWQEYGTKQQQNLEASQAVLQQEEHTLSRAAADLRHAQLIFTNFTETPITVADHPTTLGAIIDGNFEKMLGKKDGIAREALEIVKRNPRNMATFQDLQSKLGKSRRQMETQHMAYRRADEEERYHQLGKQDADEAMEYFKNYIKELKTPGKKSSLEQKAA